MTRKAACRSIALSLLLGLLVGGLPWPMAQASGRTMTLMTAGTTIVLEGNLARARNMAIANGKRNALEEAVRALVPASVVFENYDIINENIYQQYERYIDTYRILAETSRGNIYEVTLESTVAVEKLKKTLVGLRLMEEDLESEWSHFRLKILEVSCASCFRALKEYIQNEMEGVEEVSLDSISPGRFTLDIVFRGDIEAFRDALTSRNFEDFRLDPEEMDEEQLRVLMVLNQPEDGLWR